MNRRSAFLFFILHTLTQAVTAGSVGPEARSWQYVGTLSIGAIWPGNNPSQVVFFTPTNAQSYTKTSTTGALVDAEVFFGGQRALSAALLGQLGLAIAATNSGVFSGFFWDEAYPLFSNFSYTYRVQHTHLAAKGKLLLDKGYALIPWVSASLGVGWNNTSSFRSAPLNSTITPPIADFNNNTQTAFAYTLGIGVQYVLNPTWQVGAAYEFADWGRGQFAPALGQFIGRGFKVRSVYTNGLLLNISYLA